MIARRLLRCVVLGLAPVLLATPGCDGSAGPPRDAAAKESSTVPSASSADTDDARLLERIAHAERETVFAGYKTAVSGPGDDGRRTRMHVARHPSGRTFMEWERGDRTGKRWVYRQRHQWIDDPSLLLQSYDVVVSPEVDERVAWRPARRVEFRPRSAGRPSMTLLVDEETSVVLGETIRDPAGVRRFQWQFDTIDFDPDVLPGDAADAPEAEPVAAPEDTSVVRDGWQPLVVTHLPDGFRAVVTEPVAGGGERTYFSDGLAAISIVQRPASRLELATEGDVVRQDCGGRVRMTGTFSGVTVEIVGLLVPSADVDAILVGLHTQP